MKKRLLSIIFVGLALSAAAQNGITVVNSDIGESFSVNIPENMVVSIGEENWEDSVRVYTEQVRWGDKSACLKLAECYHYGMGVKRSIVNMMLFLAMYDRENAEKQLEACLSQSEKSDPVRLLCEAMDSRDCAEIQINTQILWEICPAYAKTIVAKQMLDSGSDDEKSIAMLREAGGEGSDVAKILVCFYHKEKENVDRYESCLSENAKEIPVLYNHLGDLYIGKDFPTSGKKDEKKALECFNNADKYAMLLDSGAHFLIKYYQDEADKGNRLCDSVEIERLKRLLLRNHPHK